jgi:hypothetical protein
MFDLFFNPPKIQIVKHQICPVKLNEQKFGATMYFLEDLKDNYRKVASTNASRFVTRLVYMHTQNDTFLIRSPS